MPADPVVSPADTIRLDEIRERAEYAVSSEMAEMLVDAPEDGHRWARYLGDDILALLAVGERDKAEISGLKAEVARLADRAVCSGCGSDVGESGVCTYSDCDDGEMIPASDLPVALRNRCDSIQEDRAEWRSDWEALRAEAKALEVAGERDRQQIARLTEFVSAYDNLEDALDNLLDYLKLVSWSPTENRNVRAAVMWADRVAGYFGRCNAARAVLAGEEDADNG